MSSSANAATGLKRASSITAEKLKALDAIDEMPILAVIATIEAHMIDIEKEMAELEDFALDDVKGGGIDNKMCSAARREEVQYLGKRKIFDVRNIEKAWQVTGKAPTSVRWVDTTKSDGVRSRLVARDFKHKFAATPPNEAVKAIFSEAAMKVLGKREKK